jgi:hypothetical protein
MRPLASFETPIAGVVNGVTFFCGRSRGGLDRTRERWLAESCSLLLFRVNVANYVQEEYLLVVVLWQC